VIPGLVFPAATHEGVRPTGFGSAFIDPLSNAVHIGDATMPEALLERFVGGSFPTELLSAVLHEGTHHYCFDSPLGNCLLAIDSSVRMNWLQGLECRRDAGSRSICATIALCSNRAVLRAVYRLMTPMAEGLALLGELHSLPGASPAVSSVHERASQLFLLHKFKRNPVAIWADYSSWLSGERSKDDGAFQRTRELLAADEPAHMQPYRVGFAWARRSYDDLAARLPGAAKKSDLLTSFLCSYFFHDWKLAELVSEASRP
jgi:hypothetical protein